MTLILVAMPFLVAAPIGMALTLVAMPFLVAAPIGMALFEPRYKKLQGRRRHCSGRMYNTAAFVHWV